MKKILVLVALSLFLVGCGETAPAPTDMAGIVASDGDVQTYCYYMVDVTTGSDVTVVVDSSPGPITIDAERAKSCIFYIMKSIYTHFKPSSVSVRIEALLQDQYGKQSTGDIATAMLTQATASKLVWDNLDPDGAWNDYDSMWLLPS